MATPGANGTPAAGCMLAAGAVAAVLAAASTAIPLDGPPVGVLVPVLVSDEDRAGGALERLSEGNL